VAVRIIQRQERIRFERHGTIFWIRRTAKPDRDRLRREAKSKAKEAHPGFEQEMRTARKEQDWAAAATLMAEEEEIYRGLIGRHNIVDWEHLEGLAMGDDDQPILEEDGSQRVVEIPYDPAMIEYLPEATVKAIAEHLEREHYAQDGEAAEAREGNV